MRARWAGWAALMMAGCASLEGLSNGPDGGADTGADAAGCGAQLDSDGKNCGRCGHDCLGGACQLGQCQVATIAPIAGHPWYFAMDETAFFVVTTNFERGKPAAPEQTGSIVRVERTSHATSDLWAGLLGEVPFDVTVDADN